MISHLGFQHPVSSLNEVRNSPLKYIDKRLNYHELSEQRSVFLEKIKNIAGHGKGQNYETLRDAYVHTMEKEKQRQEQRIKERQKEYEEHLRQLRRKKIIEGSAVSVCLDDLALLDSPLLPKDKTKSGEHRTKVIRRYDAVKTMKLPQAISRKPALRMSNKLKTAEAPILVNDEAVMNRIMQNMEKNQRLYLLYDHKGKVNLSRHDPKKDPDHSLFTSYYRETQQDEVDTKVERINKVDPLLEVYQKRRVQNIKNKAQAVIPIPGEIESYVNEHMLMSESIRSLIEASKSFTKEKPKEYSLTLPPIRGWGNQSSIEQIQGEQ